MAEGIIFGSISKKLLAQNAPGGDHGARKIWHPAGAVTTGTESMMGRLPLGLAVLPLLACAALAAQPLNDRQMDTVVAGTVLTFVNAEAEAVTATNPPACPCQLLGPFSAYAPPSPFHPTPSLVPVVNIVPPGTSFSRLCFFRNAASRNQELFLRLCRCPRPWPQGEAKATHARPAGDKGPWFGQAHSPRRPNVTVIWSGPVFPPVAERAGGWRRGTPPSCRACRPAGRSAPVREDR